VGGVPVYCEHFEQFFMLVEPHFKNQHVGHEFRFIRPFLALLDKILEHKAVLTFLVVEIKP
jgi:hypothetical protein